MKKSNDIRVFTTLLDMYSQKFPGYDFDYLMKLISNERGIINNLYNLLFNETEQEIIKEYYKHHPYFVPPIKLQLCSEWFLDTILFGHYYQKEQIWSVTLSTDINCIAQKMGYMC